MDQQVAKAIALGKVALAVSGSLLRDPEVMLALSNRASLNPMALTGPAVSPVMPVSEQGLARVLAGDGVVVVVEPELADTPGLQDLGRLLARAKNKPKILVVARSYNPFAFGTALRGLDVEHEKGRGKTFLQSLPEPDPQEALPEAPSLAPKKVTSEIPAPRFVFVGRDDEMASLGEMLGEPGPIMVSGARGIGKSSLVDHAIAASGLKRLPDLTLGWGTGADTLTVRIAEIARQGGSDALVNLLKGDHPPAEVARVAVEALRAADGNAGQVMVIREFQFGLGRELDFFRKSRLEMLLEALVTHSFPLRLVLLSTRQPTFHKEGQGAELRRLEVKGLKGRFLHEIFDAYKVPEFPRDKFGPIAERIHGHPLAARIYAIDVRDRDNGLELLDDPKYLRLESPDQQDPLKKRISRKLERLSAEERAALSMLAHTTIPFDGGFIADLGISRKTRLQLLAAGLLDMSGTENERKYHVHRTIRSQLSYREISDFDTYEKLAELYGQMAQKASDPVERMAIEQEANRCAVASRNIRLRIRVEYPDQDQWLESITGMMRGKSARLDLAEQRLRESIKRDPNNADAYILEVERLGRANAKAEAVDELFEEAAEKAACPELFHQFVGFWLGRRSRKKAITTMERAVELLPGEPRLRTRLAALLIREGRRPEGIQHLEEAMQLAPMLPDAYGLLGQARREEGDLARAEELLREAVRLAPEDPVQTARLADLLLAVARIDETRQRALRDEVRDMLDAVIKSDRKAPDAYLLLANLAREEGGDLDRASWLLKRARKHSEKGADRSDEISVETALVDMAQGKLQEAEAELRKVTTRNPANHKACAALGHVLEAMELYVPAHAEYQRAKERAPQSSLECQAYDLHLRRVQAVIEAQAAGLYAQADGSSQPAEGAPAAATPADDGAPVGHQRVIRRKREGEATSSAADAGGTDEAPPAEEPPVEEPPPAEEPPVEEPPTKQPPAEEPPAEEPPVEEPEERTEARVEDS